MIYSMTGYGAAEHESDGVAYRVEIRSLNNRFLKTNLKLPEHLQLFDVELEKILRDRLHRGSVTLSLHVREQSVAAIPVINVQAIQAYVDKFRAALGDTGALRLDPAAMLNLPGVCQDDVQDEAARRKHWPTVERLVNDAVQRLLDMRQREGAVLKDDVLKHCEAMRTNVLLVRERAPLVINDYAKRLKDRVDTLLASAKLELDKDGLMREVALFADRSDISEELTRLESHLDQFASVCDEPTFSGRKLDFLTQEMLRETNTIGSKANDATISRAVVELKGLIDRIKEQVQNIE